MTAVTPLALLLALPTGASSLAGRWVAPQAPLPPDHNGGTLEQLQPPAMGKQPHIMMVLWDDYGWAEASWHRNYTIGGQHSTDTRNLHQTLISRDDRLPVSSSRHGRSSDIQPGGAGATGNRAGPVNCNAGFYTTNEGFVLNLRDLC